MLFFFLMWKLATNSLLDLRVCKDSKLINDALKNSLVNLRAIRTVKEKRRRRKKAHIQRSSNH